MCGIFGLVLAGGASNGASAKTRKYVSELLQLSASRGKEAVRLAISSDQLARGCLSYLRAYSDAAGANDEEASKLLFTVAARMTATAPASQRLQPRWS